METDFQFFPEQASTFAPQVDNLYFFLVGVSGFFTLLISALIVIFAIKYRRRPGRVPDQPRTALGLELVWTVIPAILVMVMFTWGATLFLEMSIPPVGAQDIYVVGKQWMWKVQHPSGRREINELHIPVGQALKVTLTSQDVIHSFFIPAFRIKQDAVPGQYRTMWFEATKPGIYHLFCAEYCGTDHSGMVGRVIAMDDIDYQQWLAGTAPGELTLAEQGERIFTEYDCAACHAEGSRQRCPTLGGLYGTEVRLANGETALFDETYIRESLLAPNAKIAMGYPPLMPTYRGQLTEEQILALIEYIKSIGLRPEQLPERRQ
jgi:cytochrome c oxidase subunit 2